MKYKILIVSRSFYPQISPRSFRTTELVKEFSRQGHDVTLVTFKNDDTHPAFEKEYGIRIENIGKKRLSNIRLKSDNRVINLIERIINRLLLMLFEYPDIELTYLVWKALKKKSGYDLLISVAVPFPIHWGCALLKSRGKAVADTWVADCGDPYMGCKTDSFKKLFYFGFVEKWFCRRCDVITVPTEGSLNGYYPEFQSKIKIIPQGFNFREISLEPFKAKNSIPVFGYAGGFIIGVRDPRRFLDYLATVTKAFKFVVYTNTPDVLLSYKNKLGDKLEIHSFIPRAELLQSLSQMDFLLNFSNGTSYQTPSKLIDYALTSRPILEIEPGEINGSVIDEFLQGDYKHRKILPDLSDYDIEAVANKFLSLLKSNGA